MTELLIIGRNLHLTKNGSAVDRAASVGFDLEHPVHINSVNSVLINKIDAFKFKLITPSFQKINSMPSSKKSFEDLCFRRAKEFFELNKRIYLKYSGGTDSTVALLSIIRSWPSQDIKDRVFLLGSEESIEEFPEFWPELEMLFENRIHDVRENQAYFHKHGVVVNGEVGDQLFGHSFMEMTDCFNDIFKPWEEMVRVIDMSKMVINRYKKTLKYSPFPIKTFFDFIWWYNFTNKVQYTYLRDLTLNTLETYTKCVYPFYLTDYFLRWSLDNHDLKIENSYETYKPEAKRFIEKYTGHTEHWNKSKVGSRNYIWADKNIKNATKWNKATSNNPIVKYFTRLEGVSTDLKALSTAKTLTFLRSKEEYGEYF